MSITSRYQVTVPKEVRDALGISQDDSLVFRIKHGEVVVERAPSLQEIRSEAQRLIKQRGIGPVSDADMARARQIFDEKKLTW